MTQHAYQNIPGLPSPSTKDHTPYIDRIVMAADWINKQKGADRRIADAVADFIIYMAFLILDTQEWKQRFTDSQNKAGFFYTDPKTYWKTISFGTATPEVKRICLLCLPNLNPEEHFEKYNIKQTRQKITPQPIPNPNLKIRETPNETKPHLRLVKKPFTPNIPRPLCQEWKLDPRWEKLFPCSTQVFYLLIFRTYRRDTFQKIKKALKNGETYFPWCLTGIKSLSKQLTYHPKSSCRMKNYKDRQIRKSLQQLWDLGFVHRIFRGYEDQGAGKYHIFLNPRMSARFHKSSIDVKKGSTRKKKQPRMN